MVRDSTVELDGPEPFTIFDNAIWDAQDLNQCEVLLWIAVKTHCFGQRRSAWPSVERLCRMVRCSKPTLLKARDGLVSKGYLEIAEQGGGAGHTNRYILKRPWRNGKAALPITVKSVRKNGKAALQEESEGKNNSARAREAPPSPDSTPTGSGPGGSSELVMMGSPAPPEVKEWLRTHPGTPAPATTRARRNR